MHWVPLWRFEPKKRHQVVQQAGARRLQQRTGGGDRMATPTVDADGRACAGESGGDCP